MNLMTSKAALRLLPAAEPANTAADVLFFGVGDTALGKVLLARSAKGVCAILLGDDAGEREADLARRFSNAPALRCDLIPPAFPRNSGPSGIRLPSA